MALGLRLLFLGAAIDRRWPHAAAYEGDAILWAGGAVSLERGAAADDPMFFRANAPAHLLYWLGFTTPERGYTGAKVIWCVASALACAATYLLGARAISPRIGLLAAGLQGFSFSAYVLATSLNSEALYALLLGPLLLGTWALQRRPRLALAVVVGVLHGLAILVRVEHVLLLALLAVDGAVRWRSRPWLPAALVIAALVICLPASVEQTRAARRYNTVARRPPAYDRTELRWSDDARAFIGGLPAFARSRTFAYVNRLGEQAGLSEMTADKARRLWHDEFGDLPEPLPTPVFVSGQGPLNFALANHPDAHGAFSKAALENRFVTIDPRLTLSLPPHLRLYNHGYAVGWGFIRADPVRWLRAVGHKLWFFLQGATPGLTAYNLPLGRFGERRPCDVLTPFPGQGRLWEMAFGALVAAGAVLAWRNEAGRLCVWVLLYKLAVTVAFFGYARQAASIAPVTSLLAAVALDELATRARAWAWVARRRFGAGGAAATVDRRWAGWLAFGIAVALGVGIDIHAARHPPAFDIQGPLRAAPEWGDSAFSSNARIELRPQVE